VIYQACQDRFYRTVSQNELARVKQRYQLPDKFMLFVGTIEPRKNLQTLIRALDVIVARGETEYKLVIAGRKGWQKSLEIPEKIRDFIFFTGFVDDGDVPCLYQLAEVFVFPSIYEGFGLPMLEAMASGTPVVASNSSSLPEVGGDACLYADPLSAEDFSEKIQKVLSDTSLRQELISKGRARAKMFSLRKAAEQTLRVYEEVAY